MTQQPQDVDPFAGGDKAPSLSFKDMPIGTTYTGTVTEDGAPKEVQARDYETGDLAFWPDGNQKKTVVINLEVNGEVRSLWAPKPSAMFSALAEAQKTAGARIQPGGELTVQFYAEKPNAKNPRLNPQKLYRAKYTAPAPVDVFAGTGTAVDDAPPW